MDNMYSMKVNTKESKRSIMKYSWDKLNMVEFDKMECYESNNNKNENIPYWFHFNALVVVIKVITNI
mgnify:CR=1 FL=1